MSVAVEQRAVLPRPGDRLRRIAVPLLTFAILVGGGALRFHAELFDPEPQVDLAVYLRAFAALAHGGDPYVDRAFLYTPSFAVSLGAVYRLLGPWRFMLAFRCGELLGLWLLGWVTLRCVRWPPVAQLGAALLLLVSPLVANGIGCGNATMLLAGPLAAALLLAERHPLLGGVLAGTIDAWKPLGVTAVAIVAVPERGRRMRRGALVLLAAAATTAALWLLAGRRFLPSMLGRAEGFPYRVINVSLHRALHALGAPVPSVVPFVLMSALGAWLAWSHARDHRHRLAVALSFSVLALPVNNPNTFLLSLPAQALALDVAVSRWRAARGGPTARTALAELAVLGAAVVGIHGAEGAVTTGALPLWVQGLVTLLPLSEVAAVTLYALCRAPVGLQTPASSPVEAV